MCSRRRPPEDRHHLFNVETKRLSPLLRPETGSFSAFAPMRPSAAREATPAAGKRDDVVMAALKAIPKDERAEARKDIIRHEGLAWLRRQGAAAGFDFDEDGVAVDGYEPLTIRGSGRSSLRLSVIEFDGMLTVREPDIFIAKVARGFGRGKAFGLGLMLLRRPPS